MDRSASRAFREDMAAMDTAAHNAVRGYGTRNWSLNVIPSSMRY